jgi:hypothetical protein
MYTHYPKHALNPRLVKSQTDAFTNAVDSCSPEIQDGITKLIEIFTVHILSNQGKYFKNRETAHKDATLFVSKLVWFEILDTIR